MTGARPVSGARVLRLALTLGPLAAFGLAYGLLPEFREGIDRAASNLVQGDLETVRDYVLSFGAWAPAVSLALMVLQAIVSPIPAFALSIANGLAFGALWGTLLSLSGRALAASVCFAIARSLGRGPVEALVGERSLERTDRWFERWGVQAVLLTRLVPFFPFDLVSYVAGLTGIRYRQFLLATVLGELPAAILYSWVGARALDYTWLLLLINGLVFAAVAAVGFLRRGKRR